MSIQNLMVIQPTLTAEDFVDNLINNDTTAVFIANTLVATDPDNLVDFLVSNLAPSTIQEIANYWDTVIYCIDNLEEGFILDNTLYVGSNHYDDDNQYTDLFYLVHDLKSWLSDLIDSLEF